ncbi:MAG: SusC/RagA family TonB-linked outer membrane protein [Bacteroidales bacterium]
MSKFTVVLVMCIALFSNVLAQKAITGKVIDQQGVGVAGASVVIKGTTKGAITDVDGAFSINAPKDAILVISFMGMHTQEINPQGKTALNVVLKEDIGLLDGVVVVGYGTQNKANLTGSVAQIKSEAIENRAVTSVSQALQGTMSGVTVQQTNGSPGANANIRIRGFSSLNSGGALVIVDGIPGSLNDLNPNDVASISVLKDAASAAIYGARAADGVILVTTKTGEEGKIKVSYRGNIAFLKPTILPEQAHSYDGAILANLAARNASASPFYSESMIEAMRDPSMTAIPRADEQEWDYVADFDWADYFLKNYFTQNHNLSVSGGSSKNQYLLSMAWLDQNGYFSEYGPDNFDRYNLRLNMVNELIENKLSLETRLNFSNSSQKETSVGTGSLIQSVVQAGRSMPLRNPNGTYARYRMQQNTMQLLKEAGFDEDLTNRLEGQMSLNWKVYKDLSIKSRVGYTVNWKKGTLFGRAYYKHRPSGASNFGWVNQPSRVILDNSFNKYYTAQTTANYDKSVNKHNFKLLAGASVEENHYETNNATRFNILGNEMPALNLGSASSAKNDYGGNEWGIVSGFGRFNYDYDGKYLFEANLRADASSRFSESQRWGYFPSVSGGWRISEENFMQNASFISNLKLRASYGEVGNQNGLGYYDHIPVYTVSDALIPFPAGNEQQIYNPKLPSQNRTWETISTTNFGIDVGLFDNRLTFEGDYFIKWNRDMLIGIEVPSVIGINVPTNNYGELRTKGWEISLAWTDEWEEIGLKYNVRVNLYDQTDEIKSLSQSFVNVSAGIKNLQGYPVNSIFAYEAAGYFQTDTEAQSWAFQHANTAAGDIKYIDQDNDNKITAPNDLKYVGNTTPRYVYGINFGAEWKNFDLSMLFQGVGKRNYYLNGTIMQPYYNTWDNNSFAVHQDYWTPDNPNALFPRPYMGSSWNYQWSTHWLQDASYMRLKNLQIGYNWSPRNIGIEKIRIYFSGENIGELTDFIMFDPEISSTNAFSYPLNRSYSFGLNLTF